MTAFRAILLALWSCLLTVVTWRLLSSCYSLRRRSTADVRGFTVLILVNVHNLCCRFTFRSTFSCFIYINIPCDLVLSAEATDSGLTESNLVSKLSLGFACMLIWCNYLHSLLYRRIHCGISVWLEREINQKLETKSFLHLNMISV